jgi:serine protease Do
VVNDADEIYVTLLDKREFKARIVGSDARTDVALIKIDATGMPRLPIGDPNRLRKGEWVVAIGSPFGLESTVTAGIVSAKGRDTGDYLPFIQTDVAVNPGNSGGPLLNLRGEVVGINSQIISRSGGFMGISLAIPIDEAMQVAEQLKANGRVIRGRIGVQIGEVSKDIAEAIGLGTPRGALIRGVEKGSPAERAGIEPGDVVLRVDGRQIEKWSDLPRTVGSYRPGTNATIELWRKGATRTVQITVAETEPDRRAEAPAPAQAQPAQVNAAGLAVADLSESERTELRIRGGVRVTRAEGPAASIGIREGDIILALNTQDVTSASQFNELVQRLDRNRVHGLLVRRGEASQWVPLRLPR